MITKFERKPELDALINEYHLELSSGGKVGTKYCPKSKIPALKAVLTERKTDLLEYIPASIRRFCLVRTGQTFR